MAKNRKAEVDAAAKELDFAKNKYQLELDTSMGKITLDMLSDVAPGHCTNLLSLAKIGYYDGLIFHRIIKGFMIQGGCPEGSGSGGPGYTIKAEFNDTKHEPGVVSMARTSDPNSAGSQFFICLEKVTHLDRQYSAFGKNGRRRQPRRRQENRRSADRRAGPSENSSDDQQSHSPCQGEVMQHPGRGARD